MSALEIAMLVCFGASWPFAICKTYRTKNVEGKSFVFLCLIFLGYVAGFGHKLLYQLDGVILFYGLNGSLVFTEIALYVLYVDRRVPATVRTPVLSPPALRLAEATRDGLEQPLRLASGSVVGDWPAPDTVDAVRVPVAESRAKRLLDDKAIPLSNDPIHDGNRLLLD